MSSEVVQILQTFISYHTNTVRLRKSLLKVKANAVTVRKTFAAPVSQTCISRAPDPVLRYVPALPKGINIPSFFRGASAVCEEGDAEAGLPVTRVCFPAHQHEQRQQGASAGLCLATEQGGDHPQVHGTPILSYRR